jgi:predicted amidohydrolase
MKLLIGYWNDYLFIKNHREQFELFFGDDSVKKYIILFSLILFCSAAVNGESPDSLTVASISFIPKKWDKATNANKIEKMVRQVTAQGAKLVVTPEGALEGYVVNEVIYEKDAVRKETLSKQFVELAEPTDGKYISRFYHLADELDIYLIIGYLQKDDSNIYNSTVIIGTEGERIGVYHKTHFWQGYDVNPPGYTTGNTFPVFRVGDINVGMMICADRRFPEVARSLMINGADLIVCPAYGSYGELNTALMRTRAFENQTFVVFSHPNHSLIINNDGNILSECGTDSLILGKIPWRVVEKTRPTVRFRRPELYQKLIYE